jgi:glycine dehydrogenase
MLTQPSRFCDAMIEIRKEAEEIISGKQPKDNNLLKNAPHPISVIVSSEEDWKRFVFFFSASTNRQQSQSNHFQPFRPYSRERASFPLPWLREKKLWPSVSRIDDGKDILTLMNYI